jgi:hypothetical protein
MPDRLEFQFEDATLTYKNFAGKEKQYNPPGERNFAVVLTPETAERLTAEGWNVKWRDPYEEGEEGFFFLPVRVRYDIRPPMITVITSRGRQLYTEEMVEALDYLETKNIDLIVNGSPYTVGGKSGIKAYLKKMFLTLDEDELDRKYAVPVRGVETHEG